jgi:2'-5' RNA ligase
MDSGMAELIRTFIAVDFDNPQIVSRAQEIQEELMRLGVGMKPVEPHNLHVTLWFFGEIDLGRLNIVLENAGKVRFKPFKLSVRGVGYFPGGGRVNVIWLGVEDPENGMKNILDQLIERLSRLGFKYDERGFTPHLTIGRVKFVRDRQLVLRKLEGLKDLYIGEQLVDSFKVKKSTLTSKGPIYSDLLVVRAEG